MRKLAAGLFISLDDVSAVTTGRADSRRSHYISETPGGRE